MTRSLGRGLLPLFLLVLASCGKCGKSSVAATDQKDLTRLVPRDVEIALVVPELGSLGAKVALLEKLKLANFLATLAFNAESAQAVTDSLMSQVGVNLRSKEDIAKAGVDPDRGLAVARRADGLTWSIVGVKDAGNLKATLKKLAATRLGATVEAEKEGVLTFTQPNATRPALGVLIVGDVAYIAAGDHASRLKSISAVAPADSLAGEAGLSSALQRLPKERDLFVHIPLGSEMAKQYTLAGATATLELKEGAFIVRADLPWPHTRDPLGFLEKQEGPDLLKILPADAFVVGKVSGNFEKLEYVWMYLVGKRMETVLKESDLDVKSEVLSQAKPGAMFSLAVAPTMQMTGMPALDVRKTNPFRFIQLSAVVETKDEAKLSPTLDKLAALGPKFGARLEKTTVEETPVYVASYSAGEGAHFSQKGNKVVIGSPMPRLLETVKRIDARGEGPLTAELRRDLDSAPVVVAVDLARLSQSVKDLPSSAWGIGGFALKPTTVRWLDAADDLRAVVVRLSSKDGAIQGEVELKLGAPAAKAP